MIMKALKGCHLLTMGEGHRKQKLTNINKALKGCNNNMGQKLVKNYLVNQKEHHSKRTFQDEYKTLKKIRSSIR